MKTKKRTQWLCVLLCVMFVFAICLCGCTPTSDPNDNTVETPNTEEDNTENNNENNNENENDNENDDTENDDENDGGGTTGGNDGEDDTFSVSYLSGYSPKYFNANVTYEITEVTNGVNMVANTVTKTNGDVSVVYATEVDLSKVTIKAGTYNNASIDYDWTTAVPYNQAIAWKNATGGTVYASVNADFFGSTTVNAFVKDGFVVKSGHNDNGSYDYTNTNSDVPASAPMLFGIKGDTAQIAPIINYTGNVTSASVKKELVQAKLTANYSISYGNADEIGVSLDAAPTSSVLSLATSTSNYFSLSNGDIALKLDVSNGYQNMTVLEKTAITSSTRFKATSTEAYLLVKSSYKTAYAYVDEIAVGDTIVLHSSVTSPDGLWDGYTTILGCRQALVVDGEIASTVTLENMNGAQSADVPRTAVGIKEDGTVVIFCVESLYYGNKASDGDTHGMSLPELAEFMYYYGCVQGANFDGGGSSQLIVNCDSESSARVVVRSSDKGSTELTASRPVMNTLLVTSRDED